MILTTMIRLLHTIFHEYNKKMKPCSKPLLDVFSDNGDDQTIPTDVTKTATLPNYMPDLENSENTTFESPSSPTNPDDNTDSENSVDNSAQTSLMQPNQFEPTVVHVTNLKNSKEFKKKSTKSGFHAAIIASTWPYSNPYHTTTR